MVSKNIIEQLTKNKTVRKILSLFAKSKESEKPGFSISEISQKTGIERHKLSGILEVLVVLGLLAVFNIGMTKMYMLPEQIKMMLVKAKL